MNRIGSALRIPFVVGNGSGGGPPGREGSQDAWRCGTASAGTEAGGDGLSHRPWSPTEITVTDQGVEVTDSSTAELVRAARAGSQCAWNELVDRFSQLLWHIARGARLNHADAADVVQTTWLRLVENLDRIREPYAVPGWLVTTCHREALRVLRANARCCPKDPTDPDGLPEHRMEQAGSADPAEILLDKEVAEIVRAAVDELPDRQRQLLTVLSDTSGPHRYHQAAQALDIPVGSIGPTRNRALHKLRSNPRIRRGLCENED
jgi:RNA polymerase sigma factor (sigma-70 family)